MYFDKMDTTFELWNNIEIGENGLGKYSWHIPRKKVIKMIFKLYYQSQIFF